jgi:hypothetical protein
VIVNVLNQESSGPPNNRLQPTAAEAYVSRRG